MVDPEGGPPVSEKPTSDLPDSGGRPRKRRDTHVTALGPLGSVGAPRSS
jgi:hypothetical protein